MCILTCTVCNMEINGVLLSKINASIGTLLYMYMYKPRMLDKIGKYNVPLVYIYAVRVGNSLTMYIHVHVLIRSCPRCGV